VPQQIEINDDKLELLSVPTNQRSVYGTLDYQQLSIASYKKPVKIRLDIA
jgi:hypothetical protein